MPKGIYKRTKKHKKLISKYVKKCYEIIPNYGFKNRKKVWNKGLIGIKTNNKGQIPWNKDKKASKEAIENQSKSHIKSGIALYRKWALEEYGHICNRCGIPDKRILIVHHKDENRYNNKLKNLEVLCLNGHAIHHRFGYKK